MPRPLPPPGFRTGYARPVLSRPNPPGATPEAIAAWQAERDEFDRRLRARLALPKLKPGYVTQHPRPWHPIDPAQLATGPRTFARAAEGAGHRVEVRAGTYRAARSSKPGVTVAVGHRDTPRTLWVTATWTQTPAGSWTSAGAWIGRNSVSVMDAKKALSA